MKSDWGKDKIVLDTENILYICTSLILLYINVLCECV